MPSTLLVGGDWQNLQELGRTAAEAGFAIRSAESLEKARLELAQESVDLVLCEVELCDGSGVELIAEVEERPATELVLVGGSKPSAGTSARLRGEAVEWLPNPVDPVVWRRVLSRAARTRALREELSKLRGELRRFGRFGSIIGASESMQRVYDQILRVAPKGTTVFITGGTGCGKELVAESIHGLSTRSSGPFIPVDCGAIAPTLIESELFGHERGAFTGASQRHRGFFERAGGGTLFLDEITEMPLELQAKLLRVLETHKIRRIGGQRQIDVDVRVVAATNRRPHEAVADNRLREDLLYRLLVFPIEVPLLRDRGDDVDLLASHFLDRLNEDTETRKRITAQAREKLRRHSWPGNVRELKNTIERAFIMATDEIGSDGLSFEERCSSRGGGLPVRVGMQIAEVERHLIMATLEHCAGDKRHASRVLGISLKTLYNRLNAYAT